MKILVTGGTGVIGAGAIPELLKEGHSVRLLSRSAGSAAREYPERVEAFPGDVSDRESLTGAAEGCDVVLHIAGIVEENPPEITFEAVNVAGTRNLVEEASRAGSQRFIYLSSLGADTGTSDYHASKLRAEKIVREFNPGWVILRPGNVYGPGDEVISLLLKMVRTFPAVPMVGSGDQRFQPIWFQDIGRALAAAVRMPDVNGRVLELAGREVVSTSEILDLLCEITGRKPGRLPVPEWLARMGTTVAEKLPSRWWESAGLVRPLNASKLSMLLEENIIPPSAENALETVFGIEPTRLQEGLVALADSLPELLPGEGVGSLERKFFWADIQDSRFSAPELLQEFREHLQELMPIEFAAEPEVPTVVEKGATLTGAIPGRGNFQVRVEDEQEGSFTVATIQGHPLVGTVTFRTEPGPGGAVRFGVEVYARPSNVFDWVALRLVGGPLQNQNWRQLVGRVVEFSGGSAPDGVQFESRVLDDDETAKVHASVETLIRRRKREEHRANLSAA